MLFLLALGCGATQYNDTLMDNADEAEDLEAPLVRTTAIDEPRVYGEDVLIEAVIKDVSGLLLATLVYKAETSSTWHEVAMRISGGDATNGFLVQGTIRGDHVQSGGMSYYIEAVDNSENENVGCSPSQCEEDPYRFTIIAP